METIKNDQLAVTVSPHGAELMSIRDNKGTELLWQADPKYCNRHSPIDGYDGDFADSYLTNHLLPGSSFMSEYTVTIKK